MNREAAIKYLQRKGKIRAPTKIISEEIVSVPKKKKVVSYQNPKFTKDEEDEIKKYEREGKIYGDPMVRVRW